MNKTKNMGLATKSEKKHVCQECGASFPRPYRLTQHLLLHNNIKIFVCGEKDCNKSYSSKSHLDRHIHSVHIKPVSHVINRCPECMKVFSNRQNLKRHIKTRHAKKVVFTCDVCKSTFKKKHLLSTHMYYHTYVKSFSCELCSKEFISRLERKKHMKFHKTYNCEHCNMAFDHWSKYLKHRKLEHRVDEYHCDDCGRKFKQRQHMVYHLKTHTKIKPVTPKVFTCWYEECGRVYSRNSNLKQHIRIKHLKETHDCMICEAQLATQAKLKAHLLTHCTPKPESKQPKTKLTGRRERKDKGISRFSTASKIAGLIDDPASIKPDIESSQSSNDHNVPSLPEKGEINWGMVEAESANDVNITSPFSNPESHNGTAVVTDFQEENIPILSNVDKKVQISSEEANVNCETVVVIECVKGENTPCYRKETKINC